MSKPIAFFDFDGTLADTNIVWPYIHLRTHRASLFSRSRFYVSFLPKVVKYLAQDSLSRDWMNRSFYREYRGLSKQDVVEQMSQCVTPYLQKHLYSKSLDLLRKHQREGHHIVIISGSLDFVLEPLLPFLKVDALLAPTLEVDGEGVFTGEICPRPYTDAEKVTEMFWYAKRRGVDLSECYAYSDSLSDYLMLDVVGHSTVLNPNKTLQTLAEDRGWGLVYA